MTILDAMHDPALFGPWFSCGIETSPAVGQIATDLLLDGRTERYDAAVLSPARFAAR
jgi:glycine/D-amino acid oxidase-like deaminating enzyme